MDGQFVVPEEYRNPKSVEIAVKLLEYYLENKDSDNKGTITYGELCKKLSFEMNPWVIFHLHVRKMDCLRFLHW